MSEKPSNKAEFEKILLKAGHSLTQPRKVIFGLLENADIPMGINEIIQESPTIDRATVYRTIELFEELKVFKRVWFGKSYKLELSESFQKHHHHLVCEICGEIQKIDSSSLESLLGKLTKKMDYQPTDHHVELFGKCPKHLETSTD